MTDTQFCHTVYEGGESCPEMSIRNGRCYSCELWDMHTAGGGTRPWSMRTAPFDKAVDKNPALIQCALIFDNGVRCSLFRAKTDPWLCPSHRDAFESGTLDSTSVGYSPDN